MHLGLSVVTREVLESLLLKAVLHINLYLHAMPTGPKCLMYTLHPKVWGLKSAWEGGLSPPILF